MLAFLRLLREKYGGTERYVETHCRLSKEDIEVIRRNLVEEVEPWPWLDTIIVWFLSFLLSRDLIGRVWQTHSCFDNLVLCKYLDVRTRVSTGESIEVRRVWERISSVKLSHAVLPRIRRRPYPFGVRKTDRTQITRTHHLSKRRDVAYRKQEKPCLGLAACCTRIKVMHTSRRQSKRAKQI